jgi:putative transposase
LADHVVITESTEALMAVSARHGDTDPPGRHGRLGRVERAREVALFRYALIREAADPQLSTKARGRLVRALAAIEHAGPFGDRVRVSRVTLDRWILTWRRGGFDALLPRTRSGDPTTSAAVLELAAALKREVPARTAAQVAAILVAHAGDSGSVPSARTLQRHFARLELNTRPDGLPPRVFGRFEAAARNDRWTGDALHGPVVAGRKAFLFAFIDDHSRALVGYRWGHSEDTVRLEAALRAGLAARGIPTVVYLDNGSAMVSGQLRRALAVLGVTLTHSKPGQPAGRGKIERVFRTVRDQFLVELGDPGALAKITDLARLNELFTAWVETVYHPRIHSETGQAPIERFLAAGPPTLPTPAQLHEAFLWSHHRQVTKTATISLHGNIYEVDAALVGRTVEVVFDPFDLTTLEVRFQGRPMGFAVPHRIRCHVHPDARPDLPAPPPTPTGIDYLALVAAQHQQQIAARINYTDLPGDAGHTAQTADSTSKHDHGDHALEVELGSFSALGEQLRTGQLPGQLDLTVLVAQLPAESTNHDSEGPR